MTQENADQNEKKGTTGRSHSETARFLKKMKAKEYIKKLNMLPHEENGLFHVLRYEHGESERASSGSCLYYLQEDVLSIFHVIDCDEYWAYSMGSDLELWIILPDGNLEVRILGCGEDASIMHFVPKGSVFACRHAKGADDGTLIGLVTVPGFVDNSSCRLFSKKEMLERYPQVRTFYEQ